MLTKFTPHYSITSKITQCLARIEAAKEKILHTPLAPSMLASLRETARLHTTYYSTMIEGHKLNFQHIEEVLKHQGHVVGHERDENVVKGYYAALKMVEQWADKKIKVTEEHIKTLHALVMSTDQLTEKHASYRDGQSIIRDNKTNYIIYLPPEAKDVPLLMQQLVQWINTTDLSCPMIASIAHYQFATIRPYCDGNGRTARLLTTLILHLGGYDLKGLYSLEEYYAHSIKAYCDAMTIGSSHSYYIGRVDAHITKWVEYFIEGLAIVCEKVLTTQMSQAITDMQQEEQDYKVLMRQLDLRQRKALSLFQTFEIVTGSQIGALFGLQPRVSSTLCKNWVEKGFLEIVNSSNKARTYKLAKPYDTLIFYEYEKTISRTPHESAGIQ